MTKGFAQDHYCSASVEWTFRSVLREVEMRKHLLLLTTTAAIFSCGVIAASAQGPGTQPSGPMMQHQDQDHRDGMMGQGRGHGMAMRIIFSLMDADGDGKLTLQEWQTAHERIFKEMDTDHEAPL